MNCRTGIDATGGLVPVRGRVGWVAHQATVAESGAPAASFPVRVDLPALSDDQRRRIRIGMTANLAVADEDHALRAAGD